MAGFRRLVGVAIGLVLSASACSVDGSESNATVEEGASTIATTPPTSSTIVSKPASTTSSRAVAPPDTDLFDSVAELRNVLGAARIVARLGDVVVAVSDDGQIEVPDEYPTAYPDHIVVAGRITDYAGRPVCPGFELPAELHIIEIDTVEGSLVLTLEDRRTLWADGLEGQVEVPRWAYDCERQETVQLPSTSTVEQRTEAVVERITTSTGLILVAEYGLGDTPLGLTTGTGLVLIDKDETAYDYVLSADTQTIYFTTYSGTGAASPPDGVVAVDVASGAVRWRLDVAGFVKVFGNRLVIEKIDTTMLMDHGTFRRLEILLVDPATGSELNRFPFEGWLIGLF